MKSIKSLVLSTTFAAFAAFGIPAAASSSTGVAEMADAEVRKVDPEQGKVTLKHGPIKSLDMPGMTMVFTVKDKAMLEGVKPGDKVKFTAADENGKMMVLEMIQAK